MPESNFIVLPLPSGQAGVELRQRGERSFGREYSIGDVEPPDLKQGDTQGKPALAATCTTRPSFRGLPLHVHALCSNADRVGVSH